MMWKYNHLWYIILKEVCIVLRNALKCYHVIALYVSYSLTGMVSGRAGKWIIWESGVTGIMTGFVKGQIIGTD